MSIKNRIAKLEQLRRPRGGYVVHVCDPPTKSEQAKTELARIEGRNISLMPHACRTVEDWVAKYGGRQVVHVITGVPRATQ
jgi:hypothetical protein